MYGPPQNWGVLFCLVVELEEDARPMVMDFGMKRDRLRPVHHYSRVERFTGVLYQLLGLRGVVPKEVLEWCDLVSKRAKRSAAY